MNKAIRTRIVVSLGAMMMTGVATTATPILTIFVSPGPITISPSFSGYRSNALTSLEGGTGDQIGNPAASPTAYAVAFGVTAVDLVNSSGGGGLSFNSWKAVASPTGAFSSELGTELFFGLRIFGNGQKFDISNISFISQSTDIANSFGISLANLFGATGYSPSRIGLVYNADGTKTLINSGSATQLVDEFDYVGLGLSLDGTVGTGSDQEKLNRATNRISAAVPFEITGKYTLRSNDGMVLGSGTVDIPVSGPEPSTWILSLLPLVLVLLIKGRRAFRT